MRAPVIEPWLTPQLLHEVYQAQSADAKVEVLLSLSQLELCLVIAFQALQQMGHAVINFELVYSHYHAFMVRAAGAEVYARPVAFKGFERLLQLDLVRWAARGGPRALPLFQPAHLLVQGDQLAEAVDKAPGLPIEVKRWWARGI